ncbi:MAG TPA: copper-binding protein [Opitutaceae bacterium]|nr:copper-binding protein [Opitutaceae bacterium]
MKGLWLLLGLLAVAALAEVPAPLPIETAKLPVPLEHLGVGGNLVTGLDGSVWLSWIERVPSGGGVLRCARLDSARRSWGPVRMITSGPDLMINRSDFPALAVDADGRLTAVWLTSLPASGHASGHHHERGSIAWTSRSTNGGLAWSPPVRLTQESSAVEFVSLLADRDGRVLAAWLDGRAKHGDEGVQQLYARIVGEPGPDTRVDASVCDCCQTTLTGFPDGSALLAYRGRTGDEIRDIHVARYHNGTWSAGRPVNDDRWKIAGCPVNGPQLASVGGRAGLAWFTAAGNEPRVLASVSPDAGARWVQPIRIDQGHGAGKVDTVMLADGTLYVTWLELGGGSDRSGLWLRRVAPSGAASQVVRLASLDPRMDPGTPRLTLVKDYDTTPAQLVVAYYDGIFDAGPGPELRTQLVTLPALSALAGRAPCVPCDEQDAAAARGYPVKGRIVSVDAAGATLVVANEEIPGVMRATTMEFHAAPEVLAAARPGRALLARIERRGKPWWIFGVKWLGE